MSTYAELEYWFIFQNDKLLIMRNEKTPLSNSTIITSLKHDLIKPHKLAQFDKTVIYCAELKTDFILPDTIETLSLRKALELLGDKWYNIAAKSFAIINWDKNHHYCGRCGTETKQDSDMFERVCPSCALEFYPRISPSIIVRIQKEDHILMARSHHFIPGAYGLIAGFIEAGESVEDAIHREVHEEVGITIKNLRYFGSQAWPFPDSLMIAFTAEYQSGELQINPKEIEDAGWYRFDNLPGRPSSSISIAKKLVDQFITEQNQKT